MKYLDKRRGLRRGIGALRMLLVVFLLANVTPATMPLAAAANISYEYDVRGQLISVTYPNGTVIRYEYDEAGNRTRVAVTTA